MTGTLDNPVVSQVSVLKDETLFEQRQFGATWVCSLVEGLPTSDDTSASAGTVSELCRRARCASLPSVARGSTALGSALSSVGTFDKDLL